ncbi:hypothetical protein OAO87_01325 [bacterium]|nr:hypothetical protein [bacterium]
MRAPEPAGRARCGRSLSARLLPTFRSGIGSRAGAGGACDRARFDASRLVGYGTGPGACPPDRPRGSSDFLKLHDSEAAYSGHGRASRMTCDDSKKPNSLNSHDLSSAHTPDARTRGATITLSKFLPHTRTENRDVSGWRCGSVPLPQSQLVRDGQIKTKERSHMRHEQGDVRVYCDASFISRTQDQTAGYKPKLEKWDSDSDSDETEEEDLKI